MGPKRWPSLSICMPKQRKPCCKKREGWRLYSLSSHLFPNFWSHLWFCCPCGSLGYHWCILRKFSFLFKSVQNGFMSLTTSRIYVKQICTENSSKSFQNVNDGEKLHITFIFFIFFHIYSFLKGVISFP